MVEVRRLPYFPGEAAIGNLGAGDAKEPAEDPVVRRSWPEVAPREGRALEVDVAKGQIAAPKLKPRGSSWKRVRHRSCFLTVN